MEPVDPETVRGLECAKRGSRLRREPSATNLGRQQCQPMRLKRSVDKWDVVSEAPERGRQEP